MCGSALAQAFAHSGPSATACIWPPLGTALQGSLRAQPSTHLTSPTTSMLASPPAARGAAPAGDDDGLGYEVVRDLRTGEASRCKDQAASSSSLWAEPGGGPSRIGGLRARSRCHRRSGRGQREPAHHCDGRARRASGCFRPRLEAAARPRPTAPPTDRPTARPTGRPPQPLSRSLGSPIGAVASHCPPKEHMDERQAPSSEPHK